MKRFIFFIAVISVLGCSQEHTPDFNLIDYIPGDAELILILNDFQNFSKSLNNNNFISQSEFGLKQRLTRQLNFTRNLKFISKTGINFSELSSETPTYTIITKKNPDLLVLDSIQNKAMETITEDDIKFKKLTLEKNLFFLYEIDSTSIISNSKNKIFEIAKGQNLLNSGSFKNVYNAADPNKNSVFIKNTGLKEISNLFENLNFPGFRNFSEWLLLDLDIKASEIKVNGISLNGENDSFLDILFEVDPQQIEIGKICPEDFLSFYSFSFSSLENLQKNLKKVSNDTLPIALPKILKNVQEIASIQLAKSNLFILNATEIETAKEDLAGVGKEIETYRGISLFEMNNPGIFKNSVAQFMLIDENRFYGIVDHFIIFSEELETIKKAIADFQNSNTIASKSYYTEMMASLSSESSILFVARFPEFHEAFKKSSESRLNFKKNSLAAFQIINEDNFAHLYGVFSNSEDQKINGDDAEQVASFKIDAPIATKPYFFKNHETDQMDIVVQDEDNVVYLISNKGTVFWKKKMDSQITSPLFQIDLYKNGNKQLAFSTGYHLEVLDRNGNNVKSFPIKFNDALTQPLSVFDYDSNRTYRFVLTQGKRVYMLGPKGKSIKGFDFENAKTEVVKAPKHIRLGTKDYILVAEKSGRLNILSRQGSIRVPVNEEFNYSENEWYGNDGKFISSEPDSNLISVTQSGAVSRKDLGLADNHRIVANHDLLIYLNENELSINGKKITLDFGLYTDPQLFKLGKRSFISITDLQAQKVFVFNQNAQLLTGFPVFGTSQVDIANADLDSRMELLVKGEENEILLYKF